MRKNNKLKNNSESSKSFLWEHDKTHQCMVLRILDTEGMYPLYLKDPDAGIYKIQKNRSGNLQMVK